MIQINYKFLIRINKFIVSKVHKSLPDNPCPQVDTTSPEN